MLLIGSNLTACFTAWQLLTTNTPFTWLANTQHTVAEEGLPELALLPGPTLSLSHHSQKLWQVVGQQIPIIQDIAFADLATTPGRAVKLEEEALLDALAGHPSTYTQGAPAGLHPKLVLGARVWEAAPHLVPGFAVMLKAALPRGPEPRRWNGAEEWLNQVPLEIGNILIADDDLARTLGVPLQPRRRHHLIWPLQAPLPLPAAPQLLLHRMPRGHAWITIEPTHLTLTYDGLADPRQATAETAPDAPTVAALTAHVLQVLPHLRATQPAAPTTEISTDWYMPDSLPYLGPWNYPPLHARKITPLLAGGAGARAPLYAPALAEKLAELASLTDYIHAPLAPSLSRTGTKLPASLMFTEPSIVAPAPPAPEPVDNLEAATPQIIEAPQAKRATEIRMVDSSPRKWQPSTTPKA